MRRHFIPETKQDAHGAAKVVPTPERVELVRRIRRTYVGGTGRRPAAGARRSPREPILNGLGVTPRQWHAFATGEGAPLPYHVVERAIADTKGERGKSELRMLWLKDCLAWHGFPNPGHVLVAESNAAATERVRGEVGMLCQMVARGEAEAARHHSEQLLPQWVGLYRHIRSRECLGLLVAAFKAVQNLEFRGGHYLRAYRWARRAAWLGRTSPDLETGELYLLVAANLARHGLSLGRGRDVRGSLVWFERADDRFRAVIATATDEESQARAALLLGRSLCLRCWPVAWSGDYMAALDLLHEALMLPVGRFERLHYIVVLSHLYKLKVLVGSQPYLWLLYMETGYLTRVDSVTGDTIPDVLDEPALAWPSLDELDDLSLSSDQIASFKLSALERFYGFGEPPRSPVPHDLEHLLLTHLPTSDEWERHMDELGVPLTRGQAE